MKVLVTGGAGFIGSHLVDRLIEEKHQVIVIDNLSTGKRENINPKAKFYKCDIYSCKAAEIIKKEQPNIIFHLAAQINLRQSVKDPINDAKTNILGALNIILSFIETNKKRLNKCKFIFSSTGGAIYGDAKIIPTPETYKPHPLSPYGINKLTVENYLYYFYQVFGLKYVSLRYANVYGPRQNPQGEAGVIAIFIDKMLKGERPFIFGNGKQTRDFVYVKDVVEANILAMKSKKIGVYNIGTGKETDINTLFKCLSKSTKTSFKPRYRPLPLGEQKRSCLDYSRAKQELKWTPKFPLKLGLRETIDWFQTKY